MSTISRAVLVWVFPCCLAIALLFSCTPGEPIKIGYLGGVSGRVADLGVEGRNGAQLAVDMKNSTGGIKGRKIELLSSDDKQDPVVAREAVQYLNEQKVSGIVGPMTSGVAVAVVPEINKTKTVLVSPTVTTNELTGIDDYFFRVIAPTSYFAGKSAKYHHEMLGVRRVVAIYDQRNQSYTLSWLGDYRKSLEEVGGNVIESIGFTSSETLDFPSLARMTIKLKPDAILILANSLDAAMLCQHIRRIDNRTVLATSEWAATEQLIDLGGEAVEGLYVAQFFDRNSPKDSYRKFVDAFYTRFGKHPGFAGITAFDATNVVLQGIEKQKAGQTLKQSLLEQRTFPGVQSDIVLDASGDTIRETFLTMVKNGRFVRVEQQR